MMDDQKAEINQGGNQADLVPSSFSVDQKTDGMTVIVYQRYVNKVIAFLVIVFILLIFANAAYLTVELLQNGSSDKGPGYKWLMPLVYFSPPTYGFVSWQQHLGKSTFILREDSLTIQSKFLWIKSSKVLLIGQITRIVQTELNNPQSRKVNLSVEGKSATILLINETSEKTEWLGKRISQWAGVPFETETKSS